MASILFYGTTNLNYEFGAGGSGLGFYSSDGFGGSIQVAAYNGRTFITNSNGTVQGPECNNVKFHSPESGVLGQVGTGLPLQHIPNNQATLKISFTHSSDVKTQNVKLIIYDRTNTPAEQYPASGVTTYAAWVIHPNQTQGAGGSGNSHWAVFTPSVTGTIMPHVSANQSPGTGGLSPLGANTRSLQYDWHVLLSATPTSIGAKTQYGLYFSTEYL